MMDINIRGTFALTSAALPFLRSSNNGHVLTLSPPLNLDRRWLREHAPYTVSKYGMTMLTLGVAEQHRGTALAANCLWPRTQIATAATGMLYGADAAARISRTPQIMADAAYVILTRPAGESTGQTYIDEDVLRAVGVTDFDSYRADPTSTEPLAVDLFLGGHRG